MTPRRSHRRKREPVRLASADDDSASATPVSGRVSRSSRRAAIAAIAVNAAAKTAAAIASMSARKRAALNKAARVSARVNAKISKPRKVIARKQKSPAKRRSTGRPSPSRRRAAKQAKPMDHKTARGLIGKRLAIRWPGDMNDYIGMVLSYDTSSRKHKVFYFATEDKDEAFEVLDLSNGGRKWRLADSNKARTGTTPYDPDNLVGRLIRITWPQDENSRKKAADWDAMVVARKGGSQYRIAYLKGDWVEDRDFLAQDLPWKVLDDKDTTDTASNAEGPGVGAETKGDDRNERPEQSVLHETKDISIEVKMVDDPVSRVEQAQFSADRPSEQKRRFIGDGSLVHISNLPQTSRSEIPQQETPFETSPLVTSGVSTVAGMFDAPLTSAPRYPVREVAPLVSASASSIPAHIPDPANAPLSWHRG